MNRNTHYGFVYLWYDTKNNKYIIGSHHGKIDDGYLTSSGGKYVKNIFKSRPETLKRRILEYCYIDCYKETQKLEQKWLDLRPNIKENPNYYNLKNWATGGIDSSVERFKPDYWIMGHKERQLKLVKEGKHNFTSENAKKWSSKRVEEGTHHFINSDFNKKGFDLYCNDVLIGTFESKVDAVNQGIKAGMIDKLRKFGTYKVQRGSYKKSENELFNFQKNDILRYIKR